MPSELLERTPPLTIDSEKTPESEKALEDERSVTVRGWVLVKADSQKQYDLVTPHAIAIADSLGKGLRLIEVLNSDAREGPPVDPVDWDLKKRQAQARLSAFVSQFADSPCPIDYRVLDNCLLSLAGVCDAKVEKPMLCVARTSTALPWDNDEVTRQLMHTGCHCALLVPDTSVATYPVHYRRIAVTLDGSARAERVMPMAIALAQNQDAQLMLLHAIPEPGLTQTGPLEAEALELTERLVTRNRRIAHHYLAGIRARYENDVKQLDTRLIEGCDVKHRLMDTIGSESIDLLVLASHGATGHHDVPQGAVAQFLLEHVNVPVLMLGREQMGSSSNLFADTDLRPAYRPLTTRS